METPRHQTLRFPVHTHDAASRNQAQKETQTKKRRRVHGEPPTVEVHLVELIQELDRANDTHDKHYGLFMWPSALVLAQFMAHYHSTLLKDKVVMELGCGTGLPGLVAARSGVAKKVYLTDRSDAVDIQRNVEANIRLNALEGLAFFLPLDWGQVICTAKLMEIFSSVDVLLAADCFYQSEDFEKVLATVAMVFRCQTKCKFYVTYQLRSLNRTIAPLLYRWGMSARSIDKNLYMPLGNEKNDEKDGTLVMKYIKEFDSVYLYEITAQKG